MNAIVRTLYQSNLFQITDFACQCTECGFSGLEYQNRFSICYIQKGSFLFKVFSEELECFNSRFLLNRPGFTHRVKHYHTQPDQCLIIGFSEDFYEKMRDIYQISLNGFLTSEHIHSLVLHATMETEYLMYRLKCSLNAQEPDDLEIAGIVLDLIDAIFHRPCAEPFNAMSDNHRRYYLPVVEKSREYIHSNFGESITMGQLAGISHLSEFHFNRVFKQITRLSPYQYLLKFRIQHASHLLKSTEEPVGNVAWSAGFNNADHFSYAFKGITGISPQVYRRKNKQDF